MTAESVQIRLNFVAYKFLILLWCVVSSVYGFTFPQIYTLNVAAGHRFYCGRVR